MSKIQAQRRKSYWLYIIFAWLIATLYTIVTDGFEDPFPFINTSIIGIIIGLLVAVFELELARHFQRKLTFIQILAFRSTL